MLRRSGPCPHAARALRDQRALDLLLQVEDGGIVFHAQRAPEPGDLAPGRGGKRRTTPATQRDGNHSPHVRIERDDLGKGLLRNPIHGDLGPVPLHVRNERERVDDVAERGGSNDENGDHLSAPTICGLLRCAAPRGTHARAGRSQGRPRERGEAQARRARLRARVAPDTTEHRVSGPCKRAHRRARLRARVAADLMAPRIEHDVAEAAAIRNWDCPAPLIEATA